MEVVDTLGELTDHIGEAASRIRWALRADLISEFTSELKQAEESLAKAIEYAEANKEKLSASLKRVDVLKAQDELRKALSTIKAAAVTIDPEYTPFIQELLLSRIENAMSYLHRR